MQISKCSMRIRFWSKTFKIFCINFKACIIILSMNFTINKLFWSENLTIHKWISPTGLDNSSIRIETSRPEPTEVKILHFTY